MYCTDLMAPSQWCCWLKGGGGALSQLPNLSILSWAETKSALALWLNCLNSLTVKCRGNWFLMGVRQGPPTHTTVTLISIPGWNFLKSTLLIFTPNLLQLCCGNIPSCTNLPSRCTYLPSDIPCCFTYLPSCSARGVSPLGKVWNRGDHPVVDLGQS